MTTLLILLSLFTLICSDTALSHFQDVFTSNDQSGAFLFNTEFLSFKLGLLKVAHQITAYQVKTPKDSLFNGSVESCAEQCLLRKFFCTSFVVMDDYGGKLCSMSNGQGDPWMNEHLPFMPRESFRRAEVLGAFNIKEKIDNVKEVSKAPTLLRKDKFDELLHGYGFSESFDNNEWADMRKLLEACLTVIVVPKLTPIDSKSGSASKYTHSGEPSQKKARLENIPESKILTDIELFIRGVNQNAKTRYDRDSRILYIDSPGVQLLIWAPTDSSFVWTRSGKMLSDNGIFEGIAGHPDLPQETWRKIRNFHANTVRRFGHHVNNFREGRGLGRRSFWLSVCELIGPWDCIFDIQVLLVHDLVKVVSILNGKPQMKYTEPFLRSFPREHVDIITQRK